MSRFDVPLPLRPIAYPWCARANRNSFWFALVASPHQDLICFDCSMLMAVGDCIICRAWGRVLEPTTTPSGHHDVARLEECKQFHKDRLQEEQP
jgi:hypothetical protein